MKLTKLSETTTQIEFTPTEIHAHTDRFKYPTTAFKGIRIVRDDTIPLNEIHLLNGTHRMIMRLK